MCKHTDDIAPTVGTPLANVRRECFALAVATGQTLADAFRETHPRSARWSASSVYCAASKLAAVGEVAQRIADLRTTAASDGCASRHEVLIALSEGIREAAADHKLARSTRLIDIFCKCMGYYEPEKVESRVGTLSDEQRDAKIERLIKGGRRG